MRGQAPGSTQGAAGEGERLAAAAGGGGTFLKSHQMELSLPVGKRGSSHGAREGGCSSQGGVLVALAELALPPAYTRPASGEGWTAADGAGWLHRWTAARQSGQNGHRATEETGNRRSLSGVCPRPPGSHPLQAAAPRAPGPWQGEAVPETPRPPNLTS